MRKMHAALYSTAVLEYSSRVPKLVQLCFEHCALTMPLTESQAQFLCDRKHPPEALMWRVKTNFIKPALGVANDLRKVAAVPL